jgi:hypothetical protein
VRHNLSYINKKAVKWFNNDIRYSREEVLLGSQPGSVGVGVYESRTTLPG